MRRSLLAAAALLAALPTAASAHRAWLLPSATVLSGDEAWVTVDAAIGNELFYFDHVAMGLDGVTVTGPGGEALPLANESRGKLRSTFDLQLTEDGTYKIATGGSGLFAFYELDGEGRRWRGTPEELESGLPDGAQNVRVTQSDRRTETFVTLGAPSEGVLAPAGKGLEVDYITHPNDLFSGETATFRLLMDGQPMAGAEVSVIPGGNRYRDMLGEETVTTAEDGTFEIAFGEPGMYWLNAEAEGEASLPQAQSRRASYAATLEVLPQ
ncbi:DUF4198 domain-containing protein [Parvularcula oceani]|uniref:DUF4198 domain-containing protein n=1 Tax=Parvularcula oceani TaxID=1247963 RepID=UPI0004E18823|nr:DUF4198 domain-containing protein [Parvularcula oceani]